MPTISVADGFGLNLQAALNPKSAFAKYFKQPPSFSVLQKDLASVQNTPLTGFPLKSTEIGLVFNAPAVVTSAVSQFTGNAGASATLCVVGEGKLFDPDPFSSPIEVPKGKAYMGLGVKATLAPSVAASSGKLTFGFAVGSTVSMAHYRSFDTTPTSPTFVGSLQECLQNYVMVLGPDDLEALGVGDVAVVEGTGSVQLTGAVNLLTSVNPLASVSMAALPVTLNVQECAKIKVTATFTITGDLQIRVQKIDARTVRMGFYRKHGTELSVQVEPSVGVTAGIGSTDFVSAVLGAISPSPLPPASQLKAAGLTEEKQQLMVSALKACVQRRLELSVTEELHAGASQAAAFLYEINLQELGADGRASIQNALQLNLTSLWTSPDSLPRGIREVQNVLTSIRTHGHSLKINVLGMYNYTSISDLALKGSVLTDPASGEVVITDDANATRVSGAVNFLADSDKLRKVLAQSFLITAAYRCSGLIANAPSLKVSYWHFAEHAHTDHPTMAANLNVLSNLGLVSADQKQQGLALAGDFGRSTFYLTTDYDDAVSQSLFLGSEGQPRQLAEYEKIGRDALKALILQGSDGEFRLKGLNDQMWPKMKETGGTLGNLAELFPQLDSHSQIPVVAADYSLIEWWATTMARMARSLSAAKRFFSQSPPPATSSPASQKMQSDLWHQMADVARNTHDSFSDPWGVLAMDLASGQKSAASAQIVSAGLTLKVARNPSS